MLDFQTTNVWDEQLWKKAGLVYHQAFDKKGGKPDKVIRNMFNKGICFLHLMIDNDEIIGVAITGILPQSNILLIDYAAVLQEYQNQGLGSKLIDYIKNWALAVKVDNIFIEVEAEKTPENLSRIQFWINCGFSLTNYIHHYIWVPEPYQAMYHTLTSRAKIPKNGEEIFGYIGQFHKQSFQGV